MNSASSLDRVKLLSSLSSCQSELLEETLELFENHEVVITPKIEEELEKPLEHGYSYPNRIFDRIDTEPPTSEERDQYREWFNEQTVDKGELEAIAIADSRDAIFFTMDQAANRYAERREVQTLSFRTLVELLHEKEILSKKDLNDSIKLIEQRDNRKLNIELE
jgi:predicted nucleic acid-binding protein